MKPFLTLESKPKVVFVYFSRSSREFNGQDAFLPPEYRANGGNCD